MYYNKDNFKIRDIKETDASILFSWWIDKEVNKFDPRPIPFTPEELLKECTNFCIKFNEEIMNENSEHNKYKYFIIEKNNRPIGFINLFNFKNNEAELGIIIGDKNYWNKGIGNKSLKVVMDYVFNKLCLSRIYIETESNNKPAIKLFNKLGFIKSSEYKDEEFIFVVMEKLADS